MVDSRRSAEQDVFLVRVNALEHALSPSARRVVQYIEQNRASTLASSAAELAACSGTSDATVVRTVQALGFAGLGELKQSLVASLDRPSTPADQMRRTLKDVGQSTQGAIDSVFEAHEEAMAGLQSPAWRDRMDAAVTMLHAAERIVVFGVGPSAFLAGYISIQLGRIGTKSITLDTTGSMLADQLLDLRKGDALVLLAYGRAYREVVAVFAEARRLSLPIILVTDSLPNKLARLADVVVPARRGRAEQVALHGATLVCLEALVLSLAATNRSHAISTLERLHSLREAVGG